MSSVNQPSKLLISSDDLEWGTGNNFNITLPEPIVGAKACDLIRATIPNSAYPIPSYQNRFYFQTSDLVGLQTLVLTSNRYFANIPDLITQLNTDATNASLPIIFSFSSTTARITVQHTNPSQTITLPPQSTYPTPFFLNTRLGFTNPNGSLAFFGITANTIPNLIRTRVIYVLCNVALNDSISTDGLRTAIAKIPVNSIFGGFTVYMPGIESFCKIVPTNSYQNIQVELLDENYQPYPIDIQEYVELEIKFIY